MMPSVIKPDVTAERCAPEAENVPTPEINSNPDNYAKYMSDGNPSIISWYQNRHHEMEREFRASAS
jgi:hypothetical protein